jgi:hypothetical protein
MAEDPMATRDAKSTDALCALFHRHVRTLYRLHNFKPYTCVERLRGATSGLRNKGCLSYSTGRLISAKRRPRKLVLYDIRTNESSVMRLDNREPVTCARLSETTLHAVSSQG